MRDDTFYHKGMHVIWEEKPRPRMWGLALGGGAARGIAHIGVLQALEEQELQPQCIAGTSVGALVGGLYAAGISVADLKSIAQDLRWSQLATPVFPTSGLFDIDRLIGWIEGLLGRSVTFAELPIPFAVVAADILTAEMLVLNRGPIAPAIRASCSIPGIFKPVHRGQRLLVDGGIVNNLPVTVAAGLGADYVVAVDLLPLKHPLGTEPKNILEVGVTSLYTLMRATHSEKTNADQLITPAIGHVGLADLAAADELIAAGYVAAQQVIPLVQADLARA